MSSGVISVLFFSESGFGRDLKLPNPGTEERKKSALHFLYPSTCGVSSRVMNRLPQARKEPQKEKKKERVHLYDTLLSMRRLATLLL